MHYGIWESNIDDLMSFAIVWEDNYSWREDNVNIKSYQCDVLKAIKSLGSYAVEK